MVLTSCCCFGCDGGTDLGPDGVTVDTSPGDADAGATDTGQTDAGLVDADPVDTGVVCTAPTFGNDIAPLLQDYCGQCHSGWTSKCSSAQKKLNSISSFIKSGQMPPSNQPQLGKAAKALVATWVAGGGKCSIPGCP